ncbi:MAG: DinB family protein [Bacteroidetes bacterium]|nr:DinB family protein [Bacteroidota bacterium]
MASTSRQGLITELLDRTELVKACSQLFFRLSDDQLHHRPGPGKWSIAEVFGHLNLSHDQYIRTILPRITLAPDYPSDRYVSGWLGEWIYEKVKPRANGTIFKLKTLKSWYASGETLDAREVLESFQRKCDALDDILRHAATKNLQRIRVPFYFSRPVRLRLGDTLRILVAHSERHLLQAQRIMVAVT